MVGDRQRRLMRAVYGGGCKEKRKRLGGEEEA
jgi:hypothetical protein